MKNYWSAIIIAFVGGVFGLQNFYMKNYVRGVLAVLFCWTYIPMLVAYIEAIVWLWRGEKDFNKRYNNPDNDEIKEILND